MPSRFEAGLEDAANLLDAFRRDPNIHRQANRIAEMLETAFRSGNKAMVAGNGGSMADALHFAEEWTGRFRRDRRPYPVLALGESTHLTCVGNDYGFDHIFSRLVEAFGQPGDLLFLLSTSGNSQNLILAAEAAQAKGIPVIGFLGRGGGKLAPLCEAVLMAPGETADRIQELHMLTLHLLIEEVEARLESR